MSLLSRRSAFRLTGAALPSMAAAAGDGPAASARKYLILACDGGGIRGLLTAQIIERLHREVPFLDRVELFAGTSTGGIIALGLAHQVSPTDLVHLYRDRGPEIFARAEPAAKPAAGEHRGWLASFSAGVEHLFATMQVDPRDLVHPRYSNAGLARALTDIFGEQTLGELRSGKSALVTTLRLASEAKHWAPLVLHNVGTEAAPNTRVQDGPSRSTRLVDAALATSAAPLYFPPHRHPQFGYCVDGGLVANCPASIALALALRANRGNLADIRILSIGTGTQASGIDVPRSTPFAQPGDYGALAWLDPIDRGEVIGGNRLTPAFPLIAALFDASSAAHNYICDQALGPQYHRVQVDLARSVALDDTSPAALGFLAAAAQTIPADDWRRTTAWLREQLT